MSRLVIIGGGESGIGAALLGKAKGYDTFLTDGGKIASGRKEELERNGIAYEESGHSEDRILSADLVVKSPGVPEDNPLVLKIKSKGTEIISEIEFACRYTSKKLIGITGSNGKTTTTLLTHHLLTSAGLNANLAGNIGYSLARQVAMGNESDYYVIELSSFQLDGMTSARMDIGVLCNITPDHMDRYNHDFGLYARSKYRITQNMTSEQAFVYNADDVATVEYFNNQPTRQIPVSTMGRSRYAVAENGRILTEIGGHAEFAIDELTIKGLHNTYNAMQAICVARLIGLSEAQIRKGLQTFKNAPHRLELIRTVDGVDYVNDSKATNVDAAYYALECQTKPVVWIAGGKDKGNDYTAIEELVRKKVKALVCMGVNNQKLIDFFGSRGIKTYDTHSIEECVGRCHKVAKSGDVVLLSPCCASFDLFTSYENRGDMFRSQVEKL